MTTLKHPENSIFKLFPPGPRTASSPNKNMADSNPKKKIYLEMSHGWYRDATRCLDWMRQSSTRDPKMTESPHGKVNFGGANC